MRPEIRRPDAPGARSANGSDVLPRPEAEYQLVFEGPVAGTLIKTLLRSDFLFWLAVTFAPDAMTRTILATEPAVVGQDGAGRHRVWQSCNTFSPSAGRLRVSGLTCGPPAHHPVTSSNGSRARFSP